jgi:hypothetical protein
LSDRCSGRSGSDHTQADGFLRVRHAFPNVTDGPSAVVNGLFQTIPEGIWGVLGITIGSTVVSTISKNLKGYAGNISGADVSTDKTLQNRRPRVVPMSAACCDLLTLRPTLSNPLSKAGGLGK